MSLIQGPTGWRYVLFPWRRVPRTCSPTILTVENVCSDVLFSLSAWRFAPRMMGMCAMCRLDLALPQFAHSLRTSAGGSNFFGPISIDNEISGLDH